MSNRLIQIACAIISFTATAAAADQPAIAEPPAGFETRVGAHGLDIRKRTSLGLYLSAREALQIWRQNPRVLVVDVRTQAEVDFVGIAEPVVRNVPYLLLDTVMEHDQKTRALVLTPNPDFEKAVAGLLADMGRGRNDPLILICRSGDRSARAADLLAQLGYTAVYSVVDGFEGDLGPTGKRDFNGWRNVGMPWLQRARADQIYRSPSL